MCSDVPSDYTYHCTYEGTVASTPGTLASGVVTANGCFDVECTASGTSFIAKEATVCSLFSFHVVINDLTICNTDVLSAALEGTGMIVQISSTTSGETVDGCTVVVFSSSNDGAEVSGALTSYGVAPAAIEEVSCSNCSPSSSSGAAQLALF